MLVIRGELAKRYNPFDVEVTLPPESALDIALEVLQFSGHYPEAQAVAKTMMNRYPERDFLHQSEAGYGGLCVCHEVHFRPQRMDIQEEGRSTVEARTTLPCCLLMESLSISRRTVVKPVRTTRRRGESSVPSDGGGWSVPRKSNWATGKGHDHCGHPRG